MNARVLQRVLAVDDDLDVADLLELALETVGGFEARVVSDAAAARAAMTALVPELVLMDARLGLADGVALGAELRRGSRERGERAPVLVILSGQVDEALRRRATDAGAVGVVAKPFDPLGLADRLRELYAES